jgi:hypothetical protein
MKRGPGNRTYGEMFEEFIRRNVPKSDKPLSLEDVRRAVYQFKVLDCMWFEGDAPTTGDQFFQFYMNEDWPNPVDHPDELWELSKLSLPEMIHLSKRLKRPEWVKHARVGRLTLAEYIEFYKNMRY